MLAPRPPVTYVKLGVTQGTGCGSSWIVVVPLQVNSLSAGYGGRFKRAHRQALERIPGATSLINVQVHETSTWWLLGITDCVTITGEAIR